MYQKEGKFLQNCFNPHATNMNVMETKQVTNGMKIAKYEIRLQTKMVSYALFFSFFYQQAKMNGLNVFFSLA